MCRIYIDCDKHGVDLKKSLMLYGEQNNIDFEDLNFGIEKPYPVIASNMAQKMLSVSGSRGVLICNSGIGMSIIANKFYGIYANCCRSVEDCISFRTVNNGNLLCLGVRFASVSLAIDLMKTFINTDFDLKNLSRIELIEKLFPKES